MHPSGFLPSSMMSFPCSQASNTSIHHRLDRQKSTMGTSRSWLMYSYQKTSSSTPTPDSKQQQFQIWLVDIDGPPIPRPCKFRIAIRRMWGQIFLVHTLNIGSCLAPAFFGQSRPYSSHLAIAFLSWDLKFSVTTLSLTWMLRALDTLISMSRSRGTTSNSI